MKIKKETETIKKKQIISKRALTKEEIAKKEMIYLIRQFYRVQEHRIAFQGQIRALKTMKTDTQQMNVFLNNLVESEEEIKEYLENKVKEAKIWQVYLKNIKGIGPILAAGLINLINIKKARHISSLWKFAGMDVVDGKAPKWKHGQKITWNPLMRVLCWKIGKSFLMLNSPYKKLYTERKKYEENRNKKEKKDKRLTRMHIHNRAIRFMVKRFLSDLWLKWRELEGLEITMPFVVEKLGHKFVPTDMTIAIPKKKTNIKKQK